jgi:phosphatidylglycerophosphate synthase
VCEPAGGDSPLSVGGITLLERILRQLCELDPIARILVITPAAGSLPLPESHIRKDVLYREASGSKAWEMLREARAELEEHFVAVSAEYLIDQRLLEWLAVQPRDVMLGTREDAPGPVARLTRTALDAPSPQAAGIRTVLVGSLPTYWEAMHGEVPLHLHRVSNASDAEAGWRILLDHVQRRTLELPGRYFDPLFENILVRRLAGTRVTANQVTILTTLLGFAVAALYFVGWLRAGVLLAIAVEVLDGVDGKLARITRTTSRAGELEHIADFFYENACYLALGSYLSRDGFVYAWTAAMLMVLFDLSDTLAYAVTDVRWGLSLDNASPSLARFRLVAGRRNIYNWLFLAGFFLGTPAHAFYFASAWAGITAIVHVSWVVFEALARVRSPSSSNWIARQ